MKEVLTNTKFLIVIVALCIMFFTKDAGLAVLLLIAYGVYRLLPTDN